MKKEAEYFGKNLASVMIRHGISAAMLSKKTGLTPASISQILSGKRAPAFYTVVRILRVLPVKFESLIQKEEEKKDAP